MSWLDFATYLGQFLIASIIAGVCLDFVFYRIRRGWLKAQVDVGNEIFKNEKNSALKEAMTKK